MTRVTVRLATRWGCELRAKNEKSKKGLISKSKHVNLGQNKMESEPPNPPPPPSPPPPPPPKKNKGEPRKD